MPSKKVNKTSKGKNIAIAIVAIVVLAILIFFAMQRPAIEPGEVDGTFRHGAETILLLGDTFEISGGAGHRHFPNGTGTFEIRGGNIYLTYEDGDVDEGTVETRRFASGNDWISIDNHRYPRVGQ